MPVGPANAGITVSIGRDPSLVRTVRLVAAAVARRVAQDEDFVEEVRLAIGEACAVLVGEGPAAGAEDLVTVSMELADRLRVSVASGGVVDPADPPHSDIDGIEPWALLRGLLDDFAVVHQNGSTRLTMSWPLPEN